MVPKFVEFCTMKLIFIGSESWSSGRFRLLGVVRFEKNYGKEVVALLFRQPSQLSLIIRIDLS